MHTLSVRRESIVLDAIMLIVTCLVVVAISLLGGTFLKEAFLGIPAGLWAVGLVFASYKVVSVRWFRELGDRASRRRVDPALAGWVPRLRIAEVDETIDDVRAGDGGHGEESAAGRVMGAAKRLRSRLTGLGEREGQAARARELHRQGQGPMRVLLDLPEAEASQVRRAPGLNHVEWVSPGGESGEAVCDAQVVRVDGQRIVIVTADHEDEERGAAWPDWAEPRLLTFTTLFPVRLDPGMVTLHVGSGLREETAELVRAAVDAASVLSRTPARLRGQSGGGRRSRPRPSDDAGTHDAQVHRAMLRLCHVLTRDVRAGREGPAHVPIARACAAWLCTSDLDVEMDVRRTGVEAAASVIGPEAESLLRAAAMRVACGNDDDALDAVRASLSAMHEGSIASVDDTMTYVQAEIDFGSRHADLSLGRIIAGLSLAARAAHPQRLAFLRDDLADDLRYSPWLLGRDADQRLVLEAVGVMADALSPKRFTRSEAA